MNKCSECESHNVMPYNCCGVPRCFQCLAKHIEKMVKEVLDWPPCQISHIIPVACEKTGVGDAKGLVLCHVHLPLVQRAAANA